MPLRTNPRLPSLSSETTTCLLALNLYTARIEWWARVFVPFAFLAETVDGSTEVAASTSHVESVVHSLEHGPHFVDVRGKVLPKTRVVAKQ